MAKFKYVLPEMEHKFAIQIKGEESQQNWVGDFVYRRPNLRERAAIDVMFRRLCGDLLTLDPDVQALNEALAFMRFTLKSYPDWWKDSDFGGAIYDANVILEIYAKCMEFEADWRKKVMGGNPEDVRVKDENEAPELSSEASPS
jgi:hypothetical protein